MEMDDLTDEQIHKLTPEQISLLENDPTKLDEIMAAQTATDDTKEKPEPAVKEGVANDAGTEEVEDEPVVLNKSGTRAIPYSQFKGLRVDNARMKEELQEARSESAKFQALLKEKAAATTPEELATAEDAIQKQLDNLKDDIPEVYGPVNSVTQATRALNKRLDAMDLRLAQQVEREQRYMQATTEEMVKEALENNPDLVHWSAHDTEAMEEATRQDELMRYNPRYGDMPYEKRFAEVVRRVRAIMPEASKLPTQTSAELNRAAAKAKLAGTTARKPTTLSDIQGGTAPVSDAEQMENLSPHELTARLMTMSPQKAAALRAELD